MRYRVEMAELAVAMVADMVRDECWLVVSWS